MDYWFRYFRAPDPTLSEAKRNKQDEEASRTYRATVPQKLVLWASEPVIKEHNKYLRLDRTEDVTMFEFEKFLFALREDLGYSNEGLQKGDLLHLFLKGVDQRLREEEQAQQ